MLNITLCYCSSSHWFMKENRSLICAQTISWSHLFRFLIHSPSSSLPFRAKVNCRQHNGKQYLSNKRARLFYERQSRFVGQRAVFFLLPILSSRIFALWHLPLSLITLSLRTAGDAGRTNGFCRMNRPWPVYYQGLRSDGAFSLSHPLLTRSYVMSCTH